MRPLYFGLKNIILKEIQNIDQEIDVHKFFIDSQLGSEDSVITSNIKQNTSNIAASPLVEPT